LGLAPGVHAAAIKFSESLDHVPLAFTVLQQTGNPKITEALLHLVRLKPDVTLWTDLCRRVVIQKCVPPAERTGDSRVMPTDAVLIAAMRISANLVRQIRAGFPLGLNCVDDLVSIAFNAIQMNDRNIDLHCFAILASVLKSFADVRNRDGSLLNFYTAQFHPMLRHSLDGTRDLESVADFCISYLNFLFDRKSEILQEAVDTAVAGFLRIRINDGNSIVFCRIAARLYSVSNRLLPGFVDAASNVFQLIAKQKVSFAAFGEELPDVIAVYLSSSKSNCTGLKLLLFQFLSAEFSESTISALIPIVKTVGLSENEAAFAISLLASHPPPNIEIVAEPRQDSDDLDASAFWIVPVERTPSHLRFLDALAAKIPKTCWKSCLSLCLQTPICFSALARLLQSADSQVIRALSGSILATVLDSGDSSIALSVYLFSRVGPQIGDSILSFVARSRIEAATKSAILLAGLKTFGPFSLASCSVIENWLEEVALPIGIGFVSSVLIDKTAALSGLEILRAGYLSFVGNAITESAGSVPIVLHFLHLCLSVVQKALANPEFEKAVIGFVFQAVRLAAADKERQRVMAPACLILKSVNQQRLAQIWGAETDAAELVGLFAPPTAKKQTAIELKVFSGAVNRKNTSSGWQSLETDTD
jgi:hypothetical protein